MTYPLISNIIFVLKMKKWGQLESNKTQHEYAQYFFLAIDIKLVAYIILNNKPVTVVVLRVTATAFFLVNVFSCFTAQAISATEVCSDQGQRSPGC